MNRKALLLIKLAGPLIVFAALYGVYTLMPYMEYMAVKPMSGDIICRGNSGGSEGRFSAAMDGAPVSECALVLSHRWRWYVLDFNGTVTLRPLLKWTYRAGEFAVFRIAEAKEGIPVSLRNKLVDLKGKTANPPLLYGAGVIRAMYPVKVGEEVIADERLASALGQKGFSVKPGTVIVAAASIARSPTLMEVFSTGINTGRMKRK